MSERLSLDEIRSRAKASFEPVEVTVSDWDRTVLVRALSLQEINECTRKSRNDVRGGEVNLDVRNGWFLVTGMVDPQITLADAEVLLTEASAAAVSDILAEILTRSGLTERAKEDAKSGTESEPAAPVSDGVGGTIGEDASPA